MTPAAVGARRPPGERRTRRYLAATVAAVAVATGPNPIRRESTGAPAVARVGSLSAPSAASKARGHLSSCWLVHRFPLRGSDRAHAIPDVAPAISFSGGTTSYPREISPLLGGNVLEKRE